MTLREDFSEDFASSAFGEVSGDKAIIGKWGSITRLDDGTFDAWFHAKDLSRSLTGRRLAKIERECHPEDGFVKLTGEGYAQGRGREFVLRMAVLAGVRKKRRMSAEAREAATARIKSARTAKNAPVEAGKSDLSS